MNFFSYVVLFILQLSSCWNKERYSPLNDFLLHEAGGPVSPYNKDSNAQFPTLKPPTSASTHSTHTSITPKPQTTPNNKRDYVAPQFPTLKPIPSSTTGHVTPKPSMSTQPSSKRDYVAPQYPTPKSPTSTNKSNLGTTPKSTTNPKRDYVAPSLPTSKPDQVHGNTKHPGKVKDLINFYDSKNNQGSTILPKVPSYSSILKGPNSPTITPSPSVPTKPTFSAIASGAKATNTPNVNTNIRGKQPAGNLPSSLLNNNKNNQGTNSLSDAELQALSEELLKKDVNNAAKFITINYQEKTTSQIKDDKAPQPLLNISPEVWNIPTIQKFLPLLDNYERDTLVNEYVTAQERTEENAFMDAIMSTTVIRHLMNYLKDKGYVSQDPRLQRDFLKQIWFGLYSRGKGKISSSGFEHIFVSELKNDQISGLHNWVYFSKEEAANRVNYLGYLKYTNFADILDYKHKTHLISSWDTRLTINVLFRNLRRHDDKCSELRSNIIKGGVVKMHFNQQGVDKPVGTMFIGTSPELEMALYTLCYVTRVEKDCKLKLGNNDVDIVTYNYRYRSKNYIGSAYPQI